MVSHMGASLCNCRVPAWEQPPGAANCSLLLNGGLAPRFGGGNSGSPSTSDASCTSGSRQNGSHASSSAGWRTDAAAQARSGNERRAEPIVFSSRNVEELPPAAAGRMRNTPLAPNGQLLQNANSIGWTTRQTILLEQVPEHATAAGGTQDGPGPTPGSIVAMWLREQAAAAQQANGGTQGINLPTEDAVEDAAWRWRFARRWHAEQTRDIDPANASTSDRADDTLAGGQVWSDHAKLNVARTVSSELGSLVRNGSIVGVDLLLFESEGGWANRGERSVLQSQQSRSERELKAARLWDTPSAANMSLLPTVEIDAWGTFRFMVLKLSGLGGEERIMVHGHNHCTEASLVEEVNRKVRGGLERGLGRGHSSEECVA